jgi:predicted enzyme related to lactoylglutathione lyase
MTSATAASAEATGSGSTTNGRFVWYDLMTTDVAAATEFYKKIAGWGTMDFDMGPAGMYKMWTVGNDMMGGVTKLTPEMGEAPPHWMASVSVADVDASVAKAQSLGAKVLMPATDIPDVGRYALIADPQGAFIALYKANQSKPVGEYAPKLGEFSWHELGTSDYKAAKAFYSALFGWEELDAADMGPVGMYSMFGHSDPGKGPAGKGPMYGGMYTIPAEMAGQMPPSWCYYIRVKSADEAAELTKSLGGQVLNGPMEVPGGDRIAQLLDPQGAMFAVHSTATT